MTAEIWVNIGSGNGLLPDGTKPLPEPMLTDHQWSPVTFILGQFHKRHLNHQSLKSVLKLTCKKFNSYFPGAYELIPSPWGSLPVLVNKATQATAYQVPGNVPPPHQGWGLLSKNPC